MEENTPRDVSLDMTNTCMLVSDSDEVRDQLDSKQLEYDTLVALAEDNLFKKYLDMSKYLTNNQYEVYKIMLNDRYGKLNAMKSAFPTNLDLASDSFKPPFRAVNGQVILIEADNVPNGISPQEYVQLNWDIGTEYQLLAIPNCMLRGMLDLKAGKFSEESKLVSENPQNEKVKLTEGNIPPHMHHSSVTGGAYFTTMVGDSSLQPAYCTKGNTVYDMFYNDSMDVGLNKNELDGTIDNFTVDEEGSNVSGDLDHPEMYHDNMPKYHAFYGFVVQKIARQN